MNGLTQIPLQTEDFLKTLLTHLEEEAEATLEQTEGTYAKVEFHYIDITFDTVYFTLDYGVLGDFGNDLKNQEELTLPYSVLVNEDMDVREKASYVEG